MSRVKSRPTRKRPSQQQNNQTRNIIIGGAIAIGVLLLGWLVFLNQRPPAELEGLIEYTRPPTNQHDANFRYEYEARPPYGGVHHPQWQNCGIYDEPIRPEHAVHSLEHGVVWITYQVDLPADQVDALRGYARGRSHMLMSPYPNQEKPIVLTAWGLQLEVEDAGDARIQEFINRYLQGPQTPERGATCQGGVGEPIG